MDIETLEKLVNLREKGVISEQEFESEKQKLLSNAPAAEVTAPTATKSKGVNWNNIGISLLIVFLIFVVNSLFVVILYANNSDMSNEARITIVMLPWAIIYTWLSIKMNTKKYERCGHPIENFIGIMLLSLIALPVQYVLGYLYMYYLTYNLLQIKSGNAVLKSAKQQK